MWPFIVIGGILIAAMAASKSRDSGKPQSGQTFRFTLEITPQLPPSVFDEMRTAYIEAMSRTGTVQSVDIQNVGLTFAGEQERTMVVSIVKFNHDAASDLPVGASITLGPYTLTVKERVMVNG